jgi:hypothetical protein
MVLRVLRVIGTGVVRVATIVGAVLNALTPQRTNAPLTPPFTPPDRREDYRP